MPLARHCWGIYIFLTLGVCANANALAANVLPVIGEVEAAGASGRKNADASSLMQAEFQRSGGNAGVGLSPPRRENRGSEARSPDTAYCDSPKTHCFPLMEPSNKLPQRVI